jgi:hypothetical protein
MTTQI